MKLNWGRERKIHDLQIVLIQDSTKFWLALYPFMTWDLFKGSVCFRTYYIGPFHLVIFP